MESDDLANFLHNVVYKQVVENNDASAIDEFYERINAEPLGEGTDEMISEAICILEELFNSNNTDPSGFDNLVNAECPENRQERTDNLNKLVKLCEYIAGVNL